MRAIADQVSELEKIFRGHPFRGDAVPSPAAQGLLDARKRYVLDESAEILYCAELAASILLVHQAKHRFPGALRPFALALAAELNEVAA